jgi:peptidoglycan/xylan/chitin deacetylase (PgdA/CDA1 family)
MKKELEKQYYKYLKLKNRLLHGKPVLVMMYHRISNVTSKESRFLTVNIENFEQQLILYKESYQILRVDDDWSSLKKPGLVLTFDDGYADNIINALPLLEKYQMPATIFVSTLNINTDKEFWWDRMDYDYEHVNSEFFLPDSIKKVQKEIYSYKSLSNSLSKLSTEEKENWFVEFERINEINFQPRPDYRSLTSKELLTLSQHPLIDIGIHTENHYLLGTLDYESQKKELVYSIAKIKNATNRYINYLAFPHGSFNENTLLILDELNIDGAFLANNYYTNYYFKREKKINRIMAFNFSRPEMKNLLDFYR